MSETTSASTTSREGAQRWAKDLFAKSLLKQAKWNALRKLTPPTHGKRCLDLGSDNGVISLLYREMGGSWRSADLDPHAVRSIQSLVGDPVELLEGPRLPYADGAFDLVVVVDLLEHVVDDGLLARELARVLAPGGRLVVNVPHDRPRSPLRRLRLALDLTDEKHGHVRPGYQKESLQRLLSGSFANPKFATAVGPFSEFLDIVLSYALERKKGESASSKGAMITQEEGQSLGGAQKLYSALFPLFKAWSLLDHLAPFAKGALLLAVFERR